MALNDMPCHWVHCSLLAHIKRYDNGCSSDTRGDLMIRVHGVVETQNYGEDYHAPINISEVVQGEPCGLLEALLFGVGNQDFNAIAERRGLPCDATVATKRLLGAMPSYVVGDTWIWLREIKEQDFLFDDVPPFEIPPSWKCVLHLADAVDQYARMSYGDNSTPGDLTRLIVWFS